MKPIKWSAHFQRVYRTQLAKNEALVTAFWAAVETFQHDPQLVRTHPLEGKMAGRFAFEVSPDCRVIVRETDDYLIFTDIGTHEQVYER